MKTLRLLGAPLLLCCLIPRFAHRLPERIVQRGRLTVNGVAPGMSVRECRALLGDPRSCTGTDFNTHCSDEYGWGRILYKREQEGVHLFDSEEADRCSVAEGRSLELDGRAIAIDGALPEHLRQESHPTLIYVAPNRETRVEVNLSSHEYRLTDR
jgi:hypothetical protein